MHGFLSAMLLTMHDGGGSEQVRDYSWECGESSAAVRRLAISRGSEDMLVRPFGIEPGDAKMFGVHVGMWDVS